MSPAKPEKGLTYRDAGVDIDAGDALIERIKPFAKRTMRPEVLAGIGGFGGLVEIGKKYRNPVLVAGTDGVGTKLKLAFQLNRHDTVGIDLVAMSVNDILVQGAEPLFFLDYYATGKLDVDIAAAVIKGIAAGCEQAGCALLGGETAELPGMYAAGEYDLAGFAVGVVARRKIVDGTRVSEGDVAIALPSSGLHSNGYSLARKAVLEVLGLELDAHPPELAGSSVGEALLAPTRLYPRAVQAVLAAGIDVRAMSHITGGGIPGNLPRVLPEGLGMRIERLWARAPIFDLVQRAGGVAPSEMRRTFNVGAGFVFVVPAGAVGRAEEALR